MDRVTKIVPIAIICILIVFGTAAKGGEITFEAATGVGSKVTPLSSKWRGDVSSEGLYFKEYATRISYSPFSLITVRWTSGWMAYYHKNRMWLDLPRPPEPDFWGPSGRVIKSIYIIPSVRTTLPMMIIDTGLLLYDDNDDGRWFYRTAGQLNDKFAVAPSLGLELGEGDNYLFGHFFDSFPMISGGGILEFGFCHKHNRQYEHKFYLSAIGAEGAGVGYRGEFRIKDRSGLSVGLMVGGTDYDTVYNFTLGYIYLNRTSR